MDVFIKLIAEEKKAKVFIAAYGLLSSIAGQYKEIAIPVTTENKNTYKKVVLVKEGSAADVNALQGKNIGSTSVGNESIKFLNDFVFSTANYDANSSKFIWVKKDFDAVLAAKIGQLAAAVVSEKNLSKIEAINPAALKGMTQLLTSKEINESPLCVAPDVAQGDIDTLVKAFTEMDKSAEGQEFLKLLGYSKWVAK